MVCQDGRNHCGMKNIKESSMLAALKKYVNPYPQTEIEVDYEYIYEPKLLKIQEDFWKGDTLHILADTSYGVTYEDDVRLWPFNINH